jgi:hypothetical protein
MNVIFNILIRIFTAVCNAFVQQLQNDSTYLMAILILYIALINNNKEQT